MLGMWMFCVWTRPKPRIGGSCSAPAGSVPALESELWSRGLAGVSGGCGTRSDVQVPGRGSCRAVGLPWGAPGGAGRADRPLSGPLAGSRPGDAARGAPLPLEGLSPLGGAGGSARPCIPWGSASRTSDRGAGGQRDTATSEIAHTLQRLPSPEPPRGDTAGERARSPACRDARGFVPLYEQR